MATNVELAKEKAQKKVDIDALVTAWEEESKSIDFASEEGDKKYKEHIESREALYTRIGEINTTILNQVNTEAGVEADD